MGVVSHVAGNFDTFIVVFCVFFLFLSVVSLVSLAGSCGVVVIYALGTIVSA